MLKDEEMMKIKLGGFQNRFIEGLWQQNQEIQCIFGHKIPVVPPSYF